jgi:hypothetical protein
MAAADNEEVRASSFHPAGVHPTVSGCQADGQLAQIQGGDFDR